MECKLSVLNHDGSPAGELEIDASCLEREKGDQAVHDTVVAFLAKCRSGSASTKTRSEVRGSGSKPYRQKGTGRARAGTRQSPIWRGGGIAFGPRPRSFAKAVNSKVRCLALKRVFSERVAEEAVIMVEDIRLENPKTKTMLEFLHLIKAGEDALVVVDQIDDNLALASRNLPDVEVMKAGSVNPYWLLLFKKIVFSKAGFELFASRLQNRKRKERK